MLSSVQLAPKISGESPATSPKEPSVDGGRQPRPEALYKEDGFETWERYCRERWEWDRTHVHNVITSAEYQEKLPTLASGQQKWTERSVREFRRIPDKRQAARVADRIVKEVEKSHKEAAKDPEVKPLECPGGRGRG